MNVVMDMNLVMQLNDKRPYKSRFHPTASGESYTTEHSDNCSCTVEYVLELEQDEDGEYIPYLWHWGHLMAPWEIQNDERILNLLNSYLEELKEGKL